MGELSARRRRPRRRRHLEEVHVYGPSVSLYNLCASVSLFIGMYTFWNRVAVADRLYRGTDGPYQWTSSRNGLNDQSQGGTQVIWTD